MKFETNALNVYIRRIEKENDLFLLQWPESPKFESQIYIFIDIAKRFGEGGRLSTAKCILNRLRPLVQENAGYDLCMAFIEANSYIDQRLTEKLKS